MDIHEYLRSKGYSRQESQNTSNDNSFDLDALDRRFSSTRQDLQDPLDDYSFDLALLDRKFASKEQEAKTPVSVTTKETLVTLPPYPVKHGKAQGGEENAESRRDLTGFERDLYELKNWLFPPNLGEYPSIRKDFSLDTRTVQDSPALSVITTPELDHDAKEGLKTASPDIFEKVSNYFNTPEDELAKKNREYYEAAKRSDARATEAFNKWQQAIRQQGPF